MYLSGFGRQRTRGLIRDAGFVVRCRCIRRRIGTALARNSVSIRLERKDVCLSCRQAAQDDGKHASLRIALGVGPESPLTGARAVRPRARCTVDGKNVVGRDKGSNPGCGLNRQDLLWTSTGRLTAMEDLGSIDRRPLITRNARSLPL